MKNDILVVRKDHIVNRIRCKEKNSDKKQSGRLFISSVNTSPTIMLLLYINKSINFISFLGNSNILNTSLEN